MCQPSLAVDQCRFIVKEKTPPRARPATAPRAVSPRDRHVWKWDTTSATSLSAGHGSSAAAGAPTARTHTSLGQRPKAGACNRSRLPCSCHVAQTGSLLCRRLATGEPADCQSAKQQVANLRYVAVAGQGFATVSSEAVRGCAGPVAHRQPNPAYGVRSW
jgi:hypothetical protein